MIRTLRRMIQARRERQALRAGLAAPPHPCSRPSLWCRHRRVGRAAAWPQGRTPTSAGCQWPAPTCRPQKRPSGTDIGHHSQHREDQRARSGNCSSSGAVPSLTSACVSTYDKLVPLESQSLTGLGNFPRALHLTSTPGAAKLASCCGQLPSGPPAHPLVDLPWARPHSVCALWPPCLYTLSDLTS